MDRAFEVSSEFERPPWAERKFTFGHPPWMLADFIERLRGVLPRLDVLVVGLDDERAHRQVDGKWSIAQSQQIVPDRDQWSRSWAAFNFQ